MAFKFKNILVIFLKTDFYKYKVHSLPLTIIRGSSIVKIYFGTEWMNDKWMNEQFRHAFI